MMTFFEVTYCSAQAHYELGKKDMEYGKTWQDP